MGSLNLAPRQAQPHAAPADAAAESAMLAAQIGAEVAALLGAALERVNTLATTGRIDKINLRGLREEIEQARRIGITGQQVARLSSGQVRLQDERLDLTALLRESLAQRGREIEARGIELRQVLRPAAVLGDATLTFSLLQALLDWSFEHACGAIELKLHHRAWPVHATLGCTFAYQPPDVIGAADASRLQSVNWRLLEQTAATLGLTLARVDTNGRTRTTLEFPRTLGEQLEAVTPLGVSEAEPLVSHIRPLTGSHVLVVAARRELRSLVREALRKVGLMLDFVTSVDEAREYCRGGMPDALVHEAALGGEAFERLRGELLAERPALAFVQITEDDKDFEVRNVAGRQLASVGRGAVVASLATALMFELARSA